MRDITKQIIILIICMIIASPATNYIHAVPAYPHPVKYTQPDGSIITIRGHGDERVNWVTTVDGYTLLRNKEGFYEYATRSSAGHLVGTGIRAKDENKRTSGERAFVGSIQKGMRYSDEQTNVLLQYWTVKDNAIRQAQAATRNGGIQRTFTGTVKAPVILVDFPDKSFTKTQEDFQMLINQPGYTAGGEHNGSVRDFFYNSSYEQLEFQADIFGPYRMTNDVIYYDHNSAGGDPRKMAREAIGAAAADGCNFANYDMDGDGIVEVVHIIYAGYGQEATLNQGTEIWAHKWGFSPAVSVHGKTIYDYSCSPELRGTTETDITYIGVIAHELSHVFGLPDFYDTRDAGTLGTGSWDIMANGSWNNDGRTPADHNPWSKDFLGWAPVITLADTPADITIPRPRDEKIIYRIDTQTPNEYFLIENRQQEDQDSYVPSSGMLIYHVDMNFSGWNSNQVNAYPKHRGMYIKQAGGDASSTSDSRADDPYPYESNNSFTDTSVPGSLSWDEAETGKPITDITHDTTNGTVSFKYLGGSGNAALTNITVSEGTLTPAFDIHTFAYTVTVENSVATIDVTGTAHHPEATVTGNVTNKALDVGENPVAITVTAKDEVTTNIYTVTVIRETPVGIDGITPEGKIQYYPGSIATDYIRIKGINQPATVSIYTAHGAVALQRKVEEGENIFVGNLPSGVYVLRVEGVAFKVVKR